ncbi:hypothetical protein NDU88_006162 [Pleurodeles waltl]|uniref:Uncharacterized protein n=1 Tax=Pleurodeles waltl TaxID=8319 RepID=A0AAV7W9T6_PLEWA|nr:hypothetical protein NDU88_006162 [Pleurodeles waltl]
MWSLGPRLDVVLGPGLDVVLGLGLGVVLMLGLKYCIPAIKAAWLQEFLQVRAHGRGSQSVLRVQDLLATWLCLKLSTASQNKTPWRFILQEKKTIFKKAANLRISWSERFWVFFVRLGDGSARLRNEALIDASALRMMSLFQKASAALMIAVIFLI